MSEQGVVSAAMAGAAIGSLLGGPVADVWGRRASIMATGWVFTNVCADSTWLVCAVAEGAPRACTTEAACERGQRLLGVCVVCVCGT